MSHKNTLSVSYLKKNLKVTLLQKSNKGGDWQSFTQSLPSSTGAQAEVITPLKCILPISSRILHLLF